MVYYLLFEEKYSENNALTDSVSRMMSFEHTCRCVSVMLILFHTTFQNFLSTSLFSEFFLFLLKQYDSDK